MNDKCFRGKKHVALWRVEREGLAEDLSEVRKCTMWPWGTVPLVEGAADVKTRW